MASALFAEGVYKLFKTWTALNLAVENLWGGVDSEDKRDWFVGVVVEYYEKNGQRTDPFDVEQILEQVMSDEFSTILEDDSAYQIAQTLSRMYTECLTNKSTIIDNLRAKQSSRPTGHSYWVLSMRFAMDAVREKNKFPPHVGVSREYDTSRGSLVLNCLNAC
ncbi:873_t:CDS:2 [Paraglomus brasilianum]|uniref:873_t:CDS:1 n=1 Tax=Paraglomus brasilianum TaxID=144538 RepID=A0A9N8ZP40_9GLOM|nr:873_t:CDS:2 [Paraglomus brasilianum]